MNVAFRFHGTGQHADAQDLSQIMMTALEPLASCVKQVVIYVEDVNGPKGGVDKHCRCVVHLRRWPPVVIRDRDENVYALVHRIADRAAEALRRRKDRVTSRSVPEMSQIVQ